MAEADAIRAGALAVRSAAIKDIASGDGITLYVINKDGMKELTREEIEGVLGDNIQEVFDLSVGFYSQHVGARHHDLG